MKTHHPDRSAKPSSACMTARRMVKFLISPSADASAFIVSVALASILARDGAACLSAWSTTDTRTRN